MNSALTQRAYHQRLKIKEKYFLPARALLYHVLAETSGPVNPRDWDLDSRPRDSRDRDKNMRDSLATEIPGATNPIISGEELEFSN